MKKMLCFTAAVILLLSASFGVCAVSTADAVQPVDIERKCSLSVTLGYGDSRFSGSEIRLWHIADINREAVYELSDRFSEYPIDISAISSRSEWRELTGALNSYIVADKIDSDLVSATDNSGTAFFGELKAGIYLVSGLSFRINGESYSFESFAVAVPGVSGGEWVYDVTAAPKLSELLPPSGEDIEYSAVKAWKDGGDRSKRPMSVTVGIYKNGELFNTAELSAANDWKFSWNAPDNGDEWTVAERNVPSGYRVAVQKNGTTFNIINVGSNGSDAPKTGIRGDMTVYLLISAVCGAVLIISGLLIGRRKNAK